MNRDPYSDLFDDLVPRAVSPDSARARLAELSPVFVRARRKHRIRVGLVSGLGLAGVVVAGAMTVGALSDPAPSRAVVASNSGPGLSDSSSVVAGGDEDVEVLGTESSGSDGDAGVPAHLVPADESGTADVEDGPDDVSTGLPDGSVESGDDGSDDPEAESESVPEDSTEGSESLEVAETPGGSVTVDVVDGALVLVSSDPAPGFVASVESQSPLEIAVKLSDGTSEYVAKFVLQADGSIETTVEPSPQAESESEHEGESPEGGDDSSSEAGD